MDLATFEWLLTPAGAGLMTRAEQLHDEGLDPLHAGARLRAETTPERAAAAMSQMVLRRAAVAKFGDAAGRMWFTRDGLEQATRPRVAEHRAARVALASPGSVLDLGCGIGGDLVALSAAGLVVAGVDKDPVRVAMATANLRALGLDGAVLCADGTALDLSGFGVVFADPARRTTSGRVFSVDGWDPPWSFVTGLLERAACVKVAPGLPHSILPPGVEAEWVSDDGEVKEAALWSPALASASRRATVIRSSGLATLTEEDDPGAEVRALGRYLYEPDGAVIRAHLVTAVAALVGGGLLDQHLAYLSADAVVRTPFARAYEVLEVLPYREKQLKAALRERGIGRLTIKKRGVDVAPDALRRRLALQGDHEATLVLTRVAGEGTALLVEPLR